MVGPLIRAIYKVRGGRALHSAISAGYGGARDIGVPLSGHVFKQNAAAKHGPVCAQNSSTQRGPLSGKTMKLLYLTGAVFLSISYVHAQTSPTPPTNATQSTSASSPPAKANDPADQSKGQDVAGNPQPPTQHSTMTPPTTGQNAGTGNNLVGNNTGQMTNSAKTDFATLDMNKRGYITSADVKNDSWAKSNFAKCDADHDGHVTSAEYATCK
jgi:hypothetical protein